MAKSKCEECGCYNVDLEGFGTDEDGDNYTEYICEECGYVTRVYE